MLNATGNAPKRQSWQAHRRAGLRFRACRVGLVAGLALVIGACNDSGTANPEDDSNNHTNDNSAGSDSEGTGEETTGTPGDISALEASTTACEVLANMGAAFANNQPTTTEEVRADVDAFVLMVNKMAETTSDPALADRLRAGAENHRQFAEDVNYDPAVMDPTEQPDYPGAEADAAAISEWFGADAATCTSDPSAIQVP
ncbi:MAG: hypothetical protein ACR2OH_07240 [Microthrixaceae bacterium]